MKKYLLLYALVATMGCNNAGETDTNATANDSTQAPNGTSNSSAISTNPDATKTDTTNR